MNIVKPLTLIVVAMLTLSGCSIKMAYNNLDRLIVWGVSDYVDLTSEQKEVLQTELASLMAWHRRNHLPAYAEFTKELAARSTDEITIAKMTEVNEQFEFWMAEVEEKFTPLIIRMMADLSDEQVASLPEKMRKSNDDLAEPEAEKTLRESQLQWAEEFADVLKRFTGRLNREQRDYLERRSLEYQPERKLWAEYRARFQVELMAVLEERSDFDAFEKAYRNLVAERESYYGDELTAIFENNERLNREVAVGIFKNLTEKQSERFTESLLELSEDFAELAKQT